MLKAGLVTVTFRKFDVEKVADTAKNAGLHLLEWGGDIHVPPRDGDAVRRAVKASRANGLTVNTYGSYYRCAGTDDDIAAVVETASGLGASNLRVWAGTRGSGSTDDSTRAAVTENLRQVCRAAAKVGLTVSPEFHGGTLTDHYESALRLADAVAEENLRLYWQPDQFRDDEYNLAALRAVLPWLSNVHVFSWAGHNHYPLADGERMWRKYIEILRTDTRDHGMLMEFVYDDTEEQLYRDAEVLHGWLK